MIAVDTQFNNHTYNTIYNMPGSKNYGICGITKCMLDVYNEAYNGSSGHTKKTLNDICGYELNASGEPIYSGNVIKMKVGT